MQQLQKFETRILLEPECLLFLALHNRRMMQCPYCQSNQTVKNGRRNGKQSYLCRSCSRQFRETYTLQGYSPKVKEHCLKLYVNGMGFRAIERVTGVCHKTVINWVKQAEQAIRAQNSEIPETAQLDELQTFVGSKKLKFGSGLP
jgi:transposase-like protein